MKKVKRTLAMVLALCMLLTVLTGCDEDPNDEDKLSIVLTGTFATVDPAMAETVAERTVVLHLFDNLLRWDGAEAVPAAAQSWQRTDNEDGTVTYSFHLRADSKWSDGKTVTAADFVYAWQRLVSPDTGSPNAAILSMVAGYEDAHAGDIEALQVFADGNSTFTVTLTEPCAYFITSVCTAAATMPVRQDAVENVTAIPAENENGENSDEEPVMVLPDWSVSRTFFVGNGPFYRTGDWADTSRLTLQKQEGYYDARRITHDKLELVLQNREQAQRSAGRVDVVIGAAAEGSGYADGGAPAVGLLLINQMATNMERDGLRHALAEVIDRNAIQAELGVGYVPTEGLVPAGIRTGSGDDFRAVNGALIDNDPDTYTQRTNNAVALLREAGYVNSDTLSALGTVTLLYDNTTHMAPIARLLQQQWRDTLGINVTLQGKSSEEYRQSLLGGEFTMALTELTALCNDAAAYLEPWRSGDSRNYALLYANAYDILMRVAAASSSDEARDAYLKDAEQLLLDGHNVIPLYGEEQPYQFRDGVTGAVKDGLGAWYFGSVQNKVQE